MLLLIAHGAVLRRIPAVASLQARADAGAFPLSLSLLSSGSALVLVLGLTALAARLDRRSLAELGLPLRAAFGRRFWQGALWGLVMTTLVIGATWLLGGISLDPPSLSAAAIAVYAVAWAVSFVLLGLLEEVLFRGYALSVLASGIGFWPAAVLLASMFGALHLLNPGESVIGALNVVTYALFASFTLRRTGSLWFAIGVHAGWDYAQSFVYGVADSGVHHEHHLLEAHVHGPSWLTGGSVGPEGSALGFAVLAVAVLVFARRVPARPGELARQSVSDR